ncbi:MAG: hypothetical protein CMP91_00600 [Gammaproteobacteria bacterium]|nr:hypothetical protein [Gammaproteobacteria bacterium]|tara:strand:+ start:129774 stop:130343 length:570 start_codon:yes stop_codon:yes gene_type:complete
MSIKSKIFSGYSLFELLIALAIASVLLNLAIPGYANFIERNQARVVIEQLQRAISLARQTAVNEGRMTTLCRSKDGKHCGGKWQEGFIVFTDQNGDRKINGKDRLVEVFPALAAKGTLIFRAFQNKQYLQMTAQGFTNYQNGNFTFCPASQKTELAQQLIINRAGRTYLARDRNEDGIKEGASGKPISC